MLEDGFLRFSKKEAAYQDKILEFQFGQRSRLNFQLWLTPSSGSLVILVQEIVEYVSNHKFSLRNYVSHTFLVF